ncbi:LysR family transcriptional regulator [Xylophilus ampelinus]|uniref:LysR family transcriptional regulator n=1 Tax=Xylophilus ampelinus TaxID=54067 RepID=A0A318SIB2_9BURK|nr:LysR family transcriptional regulator [Xylophilus ampelinus]MCS4510310.1 LysR family transcriptional regulator [Xylophilus ampelinus]PYE78067.1 LysR family transcriptional regulator [Xylophilus ampelinus]
MNLRFVEAFHWAVTLKSVTGAAEKLHLTQSAISSRISALEHELNVLLLDRSNKHFRLTAAGQRFHLHAKNLLEMHMHIRADMGQDPTHKAVLRVGAIESVVHSWLTDWVEHMRLTHPDFALELTVETSPVLIERLQRGKQDMVFAALPAIGHGMRSKAVAAMPICFVGHKDLHLRQNYRLQDLLALDLMTFQRGSQPYLTLTELFRKAGGPLPRVHAISSISAMVQLVEAGFGVAMLPQQVVESLAGRFPIRSLPCDVLVEPLQIHASYCEDPSSSLPEAALKSALVHAMHAPRASKKSMS